MNVSMANLQTEDFTATFNLSSSHQPVFILMGIPGLENAHVWISIPFAMSYCISLMGNVIILFLVGTDQMLHKPMYLLICMLAFADIVLSTGTLPKTLCIFWFNWKDITVAGCLSQMFLLHTVSFMQSAILVTMAFDRYIAICHPLRYATILTNERVAKLGIVGLMRAVFLMLPLPLLLSRLPFCGNRTIAHTYCEHMAVVKLSCGDTTVNRMYSLVAAFVISGLDLMLIALSYGVIIRVILRMSSRTAYQKALNTCTTHICVMLSCYIPGFFTSLTHRFGQGISLHTHIILAYLSFLISPMLNPIIYGAKTKELRDKVRKCICRM